MAYIGGSYLDLAVMRMADEKETLDWNDKKEIERLARMNRLMIVIIWSFVIVVTLLMIVYLM